tara:strand:- start:4697 stop:5344 length:648 start_codon:yes stop_codon:yes gene_type:complete
MGQYSKLDAINHMLLMSGEHIANHLENDSGVDTSVAEHILEETIVSYVMRGVVNNCYYKKYLPDSNGNIYLPSGTVHAELAEDIYSTDQEQYILASYKGSPPYLFNVTDNSSDWTGLGGSDGVRIKLVVNLEFSDIETPMQRAIMSGAARDYQMISQGDPRVDQYLAQREAIYSAKGKGADVHQKRRSFLNGDVGTRLASTRNFDFRGPSRRYRK